MLIFRVLLVAFIVSVAMFILSVVFNVITIPFQKKWKNTTFKIPLLKSFLGSFLFLSITLFSLGCFYDLSRVVNIQASPALLPGDFITVRKTDKNHTFNRGQIILHDYNNVHYISRVIAESGDTVSIESGIIYVNDKPLFQTYVSQLNQGRMRYDIFYEENHGAKYSIVKYHDQKTDLNVKKVTVPGGKVFCLSDARYISSYLQHTMLDKSQIFGYVNKIIVSWDQESKSFRERRLGVDPYDLSHEFEE